MTKKDRALLQIAVLAAKGEDHLAMRLFIETRGVTRAEYLKAMHTGRSAYAREEETSLPGYYSRSR